MLLGFVAFALAPRTAAIPAGAVAGTATYADVAPIVAERCAVCHAAHPTQAGYTSAPEGVLLDSPQHVAANARRMYVQAVQTHAMPLGNATNITLAERATLGRWIENGAKL